MITITCFHPFKQTLSYVAHLEIKICYVKNYCYFFFFVEIQFKITLVVNYLQVKLQAFKKQILVVSTPCKKNTEICLMSPATVKIRKCLVGIDD